VLSCTPSQLSPRSVSDMMFCWHFTMPNAVFYNMIMSVVCNNFTSADFRKL
jgi:hypothetical protein